MLLRWGCSIDNVIEVGLLSYIDNVIEVRLLSYIDNVIEMGLFYI